MGFQVEVSSFGHAGLLGFNLFNAIFLVFIK